VATEGQAEWDLRYPGPDLVWGAGPNRFVTEETAALPAGRALGLGTGEGRNAIWLGDRWWTFDPRNNTRRKGRVVIGQGRDASGVAMATTFGGPFLEAMVVQAEEAPR
jgi:transglutaminase-like putative cysteine protease